MNDLIYAAQYIANDGGVLVGALLMALLIVAGLATITVGVVLYVKDGANPEVAAPVTTDHAAEPEAAKTEERREETSTAVQETAQETAESATEAAEEPTATDEPEAATEPDAEETAPTTEEAVEETTEEAVEETAEEETAATTDEYTMPTFIDDIISGLGDESKDVFSYRVIGRNYGAMNTMKDVRDYATEKEFLDDFFKNANRFYRPFNAEIFTALYERQKPNKKGNDLSKLNVRYANALYYYRKDDPALVGKTIMLLKDDVEYQLSKDSTYLKKVPSLKKLILIYSARGEYDEAIAYCDRAIERKIYDVRQSGFEPRRKALIEKRDRAEARKARAAKKLAAKD